MGNTTDSNKIIISKCQLNIYILFVVGLIFIYLLLKKTNFWESSTLLDLITIFAGVSNIAVIFFGYSIAGKLNTRKEGSNYYPYKYDKETNNIIKNISLVNVNQLYNLIQNLLNNDIYFKTVYRLQFSDPDFKILWNDYNFYDSCKQTKKHKNRRDLIEKYVFQKIYDDYMKNNNK